MLATQHLPRCVEVLVVHSGGLPAGTLMICNRAVSASLLTPDRMPIQPRPGRTVPGGTSQIRGVIDCTTQRYVGVRGILLSELMHGRRVDYRLVQQYVEDLSNTVALRGGRLQLAFIDATDCPADDDAIVVLRRLMQVNGVGLVIEHAAGVPGISHRQLRALKLRLEPIGVPVALRVPNGVRSIHNSGILLATVALIRPRIVVVDADDPHAQLLMSPRKAPLTSFPARRLTLWSSASEPSDYAELAQWGVDFADVPIANQLGQLPLNPESRASFTVAPPS